MKTLTCRANPAASTVVLCVGSVVAQGACRVLRVAVLCSQLMPWPSFIVRARASRS